MPWFIYNYPDPPNIQHSYSLVPEGGVPSCTGETLCAIYAQSNGAIPAKPLITPEIQDAITQANLGTITPGVTLLRPEP